MKIIGLTGGIASGKSTVAQVLAGLGVPVVDADQLSREVVQPGRPAHAEIARRWPEAIRPDRTVDRARLASIVFSDEAQRRELTAIVLPRVRELFLARAQALESKGHSLCIFEAATLLEERLESLVDGVLVVSAPAEAQVRRLIERKGYTEEQARARIAAQLPLAEKVRRARWVLENAGSEEELARRARELWERIRRET